MVSEKAKLSYCKENSDLEFIVQFFDDIEPCDKENIKDEICNLLEKYGYIDYPYDFLVDFNSNDEMDGVEID